MMTTENSFDTIIKEKKDTDLDSLQAKEFLYFIRWKAISYIEKSIFCLLEQEWQDAIESGENPTHLVSYFKDRLDKLTQRPVLGNSSFMHNVVELCEPKVYSEFIREKEHEVAKKKWGRNN